jgi:hypothetical protein
MAASLMTVSWDTARSSLVEVERRFRGATASINRAIRGSRYNFVYNNYSIITQQEINTQADIRYKNVSFSCVNLLLKNVILSSETRERMCVHKHIQITYLADSIRCEYETRGDS